MKQTIARISVLVPDYDVALAFYRDALGFDLIEDTDMGGGRRWVLVRPKGALETALLLVKTADETEAAFVGRQTAGRVAFFLHTDDFARDHAAMQAAGVTFHEAPRVEPYGTIAIFADPFGNLWDLMQPAG
ncbi:putative enzyme related to lactoylglutathione lyase [Rhizobium sp. PP-F2F-G36]|nr:putative enzyme related to lactoylglutathione lyase [Rhizobium sp. PP-F2F-G36]